MVSILSSFDNLQKPVEPPTVDSQRPADYLQRSESAWLINERKTQPIPYPNSVNNSNAE